MTAAYVDTSCLLAIAFGEASAAAMAKRLRRCSRLVSSAFLEAELQAALRREHRDEARSISAAVQLVVPDRPLVSEVTQVLTTGYVRGGDCWHLATALYLAPQPRELTFLTLDLTQRKVARKLGFRV